MKWMYRYLSQSIYIYLEPFHDPCFDWKFGLVLGGWVPSTIEDIEVIWALGIYTI